MQISSSAQRRRAPHFLDVVRPRTDVAKYPVGVSAMEPAVFGPGVVSAATTCLYTRTTGREGELETVPQSWRAVQRHGRRVAPVFRPEIGEVAGLSTGESVSGQ